MKTTIHYPGDLTFILDYDESVDCELLILSFIAMKMHKGYERKKYEHERQIHNITSELKPWR